MGGVRALALLEGTLIGDTIFSIPALRAARRHLDADADLWLMHRPGFEGAASPAIEILQGTADPGRLVPLPLAPTHLQVARFLLHLRRIGFTHAVYVDWSGLPRRSLDRYALLLRLGGIRQLIGFHHYTPFVGRARTPGEQPTQANEALRRLQNLARDGVDVSSASDFSGRLLWPSRDSEDAVRGWLHGRRQWPERPLVALCPGARSPANLWPFERFVEIGRRLSSLDLCELVVCGGRPEAEAAARLTEAWGQGMNAAGAFSPMESAALLSECRFMIGLDTGTTHLAAAVGTRCITLQGGRAQPGIWDPPGRGHIVLRFPVPCEGCTFTICPLTKHLCMRGITVDMVWETIERMADETWDTCGRPL